MSLSVKHLPSYDAPTFFAWVTTLMAGMLGWRLVKQALLFVLEKLYELFIQRNALGL
ncbi:hypothetical protein V9K67_15370 [Paraflavisolibacter sp. H34]|uniref:hypothetical protein n=1 Tax=Huijunlia imazamoxiresistens TaxID=3127457 RepID=UPI00301646A1